MKRAAAVLALLVVSACPMRQRPAPHDVHVAAAAWFTAKYAQSRLARWNVRASAMGGDCDVLFVDTSLVMEDSLVDTLHYGAGAYAVVDGGVDGFCRRNRFRGVVYRDPSGRRWTYGDLTDQEAATLPQCR